MDMNARHRTTMAKGRRSPVTSQLSIGIIIWMTSVMRSLKMKWIT